MAISRALIAAIPPLLAVPVVAPELPEYAHPAIYVAAVVWLACFYGTLKRVAKGRLPKLPAAPLVLACVLAVNAYSVGSDYGVQKVTSWLLTSLPLILWPTIAKLRDAIAPMAWGQLIAGLVLVPPLLALDFYSSEDYIFVAMFAGLAVIAGILLPKLQRRMHGELWLILLGVCGVMALAGVLSVFLSGSRGAVIALGLALLAIAAAYTMRVSWLYLILISAVGLLLLNVPAIWDAQIWVFEERVLSDQTIDTTINLRWGGIVTAWEAFLAHPLFGVGAGNYASLTHVTELVRYPHNIILELAAEFGVVAAGIMAYILIDALRSLWQFRAADRAAAAFGLASFVFLAAHAMKMGDISTHRLLYLWIGVAYAVHKPATR